MLTNYHTHTTFCDGNNTAEEMVVSAINSGFDALGFSGHGFTGFDGTYCMKDTPGYIAEIKRLKEKYKDKIQVYFGIEEDAFDPVNRDDFEYILGSSHYIFKDGKYYAIDSNYDGFKICLDLFDYDTAALAESYYSTFCNYIARRKPDIVGHFDLITKFDEIDVPRFFNNPEYHKIAEKYMQIASQNDVIFEVNTGAISRGYRKLPYPHENLLHILKKNNSKIILSSDTHSATTIDCYFKETRKMLHDIGFEYTYVLYDNEFKKDYL